jgi:hypothetical protein
LECLLLELSIGDSPIEDRFLRNMLILGVDRKGRRSLEEDIGL